MSSLFIPPSHGAHGLGLPRRAPKSNTGLQGCARLIGYRIANLPPLQSCGISQLSLSRVTLEEDDMRRRLSIVVMSLAGLTTACLFGNQWVTLAAQQKGATSGPRFAAVPGEKGGQDIFGPYEVVADWPKDLSTIPGHEAWTFGAGQSVFAESPNRVFVLQRGELPNIKAPATKKLTETAPSLFFPIGRLPWRDATVASPPGNGGTGQPAEGGVQAWERAGNKMGVATRWVHCIMSLDGDGNLVDASN